MSLQSYIERYKKYGKVNTSPIQPGNYLAPNDTL